MLRLEGGDNACSGTVSVEDGDQIRSDGDMIRKAVCDNITKISPDVMCKQLRCGTNVTNSFNCDSPSVPSTLTCSGNIHFHTTGTQQRD